MHSITKIYVRRKWVLFRFYGFLTVDVGMLDVDGLGGLLVCCGQGIMDGGEDLQDAFGQARFKHHAATADAHVLTARI